MPEAANNASRKPAARTLRLKWHLVLLVVGTLLPVVIFTVAVVHKLSNGERAASERGLILAAQNLAVAVDREDSSTIRALQMLSTSDRLARGDLAAFYNEAKRAADTQPTWRAVTLATSDGRQVFNTSYPSGRSLPQVAEPDSLRRVVETREPVVGHLARSVRGQWAFPVRVPVIRGDEVAYVLTAVITAETLSRMAQSQLPADGDWVASIIDSRGVIAARTQELGRFVGERARSSLLREIGTEPHGIQQDITRRGVDVYVAFGRASFSGWTAVVSVPVEVVNGPARRTMWLVLGGGLVLLMVSGAAALALSRRISRGIASATSAAEALAKGEHPHVSASPIAEVASLRQALEMSADLLVQRELERNEHVARAEAARAEAEAANRLKDEFLITVSHELRTPLQAILGWVALLRGGKLDAARAQHAAAIIERNTKTQAQLVNDLLDMSRVITGKLRLEIEQVSLATVVSGAFDSIRLAAEAKGIDLRLRLCAEPVVVLGDPGRLQQVVWNLLSNAVKFTLAGGYIEVALHAAGSRGELTVRDSGVGIKPNFLPHVFDRFRQADGSTTREYQGMGIGLAIARHLTELHGGTVRAESAGEGEGATFTVSLPLAAVRDGEAQATGAGGPPSADVVLQGARVLVVDDEADALDVISIALTQRGAEVRACNSAVEALAKVIMWKPDLILADIGMPREDGYDFMRKVRAWEEGTGEKIPAVALTAYAQAEDRTKALAAGYQVHVVKPVEPAKLVAVVENLVGRGAHAHSRVRG